MKMRWGRMAVLLFTGVLGLGLGLVVGQPWEGPTRVDALELDDEARREEDAFDAEVRDDGDDDDDGTGAGNRNGGGANAAAATDDGRDGTRDGDTSHGRGTGTGNSGGGGFSPVTYDTTFGDGATGGGGSASGGGTT
jgi:magnesium chelatase subunit D